MGKDISMAAEPNAMLAAFSGGGKIVLREVPVPIPQEGEALVCVRAVGICETDVHITLHTHSPKEAPRIMGHEWSGIVEEAPDGFGIKQGSRVVGEGMVYCGSCRMCLKGRINLCDSYREIGFTLPGAYAEHLALPARNLHKIPSPMSFDEAAMVEPTAVALHALQLSGIGPGDSVAVLGPGPIGLLAIQIASAMGGGRIILTGTRDSRLALGSQLGADRTLNVTRADPVEAVKLDTEGGPDLVLDAAGTRSSFDQAVRMVRKGGTVVLVGAWERVDWSPGMLIGKEMTLKGSLASPGAWRGSIDLVASGRVKVLPLVTHRFRLSEIAQAFDLVDRREGVIKALVAP
jgi:L-iditol 2-dehydrogenase